MNSYPKISLVELLKNSASKFPDKPFIIHPQKMTFKKLDTLSDRLAVALADLGVGKGDRVGLFMWNSPDFVVSLFGILKTGAIATPLNPSYKEREAKHQLEDSEAVAVIIDEDVYPVIAGIQPKLPNLRDVVIVSEGVFPGTRPFRELIAKYPPSPLKVEIDPVEDLALIQYTAGKGEPRGCMLTHYNVVSNCIQISRVNGWGLTPNDVVMGHLPFYHIYGLTTTVFLPIYSGSSLVIEKRLEVEEILRHVESFRVTVFPTVMPFITFLSDFPEVVKKYDLSSLRFINNGAVDIIPEVAETFRLQTGVTVTQGYGLTETSPVTHLNPLNRIKIESVGPPVPDTEQKIVDLETEEELPPGEAGEVLVRGPQVMKGYWKRPEETAEVLKDGWLHTGDIGKVDKDGYLYIVGRKKNVIKFKGFTVGAEELEMVLKEHPAVEDCIVVPKPSPIAGEIPKAFVMLRKEARATERELMEFIESRVAGFKKIREIEFIDEIPKRPVDRMVRRKRLIERELMRAGINIKPLIDKMVTRIRRQAIGG